MTSETVFYHPANQGAMLGVLCLGLAANLMSALVWFRQTKTKSGAFFLCCLSLADALFCLTQGLWALRALTDHLMSCLYGIVDLLDTFFANTSRLLTVAVVAQRWIAISRPLSMGRLCTVRRQGLILVCLLLLSLGYLAFETYCFRLYYVICQADFAAQTPGYAVYVDLWRASHFIYLSWNSLLVAVIIVFNVLLLHATCTLSKVHAIQSGSTSQTWHRAIQMRMTLLVLCLSTFSLVDIVLLLVRSLQASGLTDLGMDIYMLETVYYWVYVLNNSVNFVFYSCFGKSFRAMLRPSCKRLACGRRKERNQGTGERSSATITTFHTVQTVCALSLP